ncbi:MAG TPA: sugar transferase [Methylomirabilota bacterium]|nr:sugar transferase [Methylomirabilota bacterium]
MHISFLLAAVIWLGFACVFVLSLDAVANAFPESGIKRDPSPQRPLPRWKRILDLVCVGLMVPALVPLVAIIVLAIKLCSRGPVLFSQERIGLFGQPFRCFKFRTMKPNAETQSHQTHLEKLLKSPVPMTKLDASADSRIIPIGWFLRATGLDELPQLINVLRGEMSLVGPRPCVRYEFEKFSLGARRRFNSVPGLTGLWQVGGKNTTTFQRMIELDIAYGQNLSLLCDLGILFRTVLVVLEQTVDAAQQKFARKTRCAAGMETDQVSPCQGVASASGRREFATVPSPLLKPKWNFAQPRLHIYRPACATRVRRAVTSQI